MPADPVTVASVSPPTRSAITNNRRAVLFGDGRSSGARRMRDLIAAFAAEVGGLSALPASGVQVVRRLAQTSVELELLEAERAGGGVIDPVAFVTLVNSQRRLLKDLRAYRPKTTRSLGSHLAATYAAPGAAK